MARSFASSAGDRLKPLDPYVHWRGAHCTGSRAVRPQGAPGRSTPTVWPRLLRLSGLDRSVGNCARGLISALADVERDQPLRGGVPPDSVSAARVPPGGDMSPATHDPPRARPREKPERVALRATFLLGAVTCLAMR